MNLIANIPEINADMNATVVGKISMAGISPDLKQSINSYNNDARIIGMDIKKEYSPAFSRSTPHAISVDIVVPLRLKPGMTAMNWATPTVEARGRLTSPAVVFVAPRPTKEVKNKIIAVVKNENGMTRYEKVRSRMSLNKTTKMHVIAVVVKRYKFILFNG
jgi:hypothetical protein